MQSLRERLTYGSQEAECEVCPPKSRKRINFWEGGSIGARHASLLPSVQAMNGHVPTASETSNSNTWDSLRFNVNTSRRANGCGTYEQLAACTL